MPWKIRKRTCKQASTGKTGTVVIVKINSDGSEEQVSCHLSLEKARSAIRAKHANESAAASKEEVMKENILRAFVQRVLSTSRLEENQKLSLKHFVGGDTGNKVVQKAIDTEKLDTFEISRSAYALIVPDGTEPDDAIRDQSLTPQSLSAGEKLTLVTLNMADVFDYKGARSVVVKINATGETAIVPLGRVNHTMGHGGKKGVLSGQILGQAVEHAAAGGLTGESIEKIIEDALNDPRHSAALANAADEDVEDFKSIMTMATDVTREWGKKLKVSAARVDAGPTSLVDVPAETPAGPIAVHVKYNDPSRLFGLQQKMKKAKTGGKVSEGSPSTKIFRDVRDDFVSRHLLSQEAYLAENPGATPDELKIISLKKGTNDGSIEPVLKPPMFIRRNPALGDMPTLIRDPEQKFIKAMLDSGYAESLNQEIKDNLAPEGAPAYYFKYKGGKAGITLDVQSFDLSNADFDIVPTNDGTVTAFRVNAVFDDGRTVQDVLRIALPSSRRGHPPQINVGDNYKKLLTLGE